MKFQSKCNCNRLHLHVINPNSDSYDIVQRWGFPMFALFCPLLRKMLRMIRKIPQSHTSDLPLTLKIGGFPIYAFFLAKKNNNDQKYTTITNCKPSHDTVQIWGIPIFVLYHPLLRNIISKNGQKNTTITQRRPSQSPMHNTIYLGHCLENINLHNLSHANHLLGVPYIIIHHYKWNI